MTDYTAVLVFKYFYVKYTQDKVYSFKKFFFEVRSHIAQARLQLTTYLKRTLAFYFSCLCLLFTGLGQETSLDYKCGTSML